jgi:predicted nucleic acid-binding protein
VIFVDTSAIYAWTDVRDPNHARSVASLHAIDRSGEELLTHNYVLVEALALVEARLGLAAARKLAADSTVFVIEWIDEGLHASAVRELHASDRRRVSLVDHVSFLVMKRHAVHTAFAYDPHFAAAGFRLFEA